MGDHSHHHHHMDHSHHMMENTTTSTESVLGTIPTTTAATILQAVMTTMMSHDAHHLHRSPVESQHAGHNFHSDQMAADSSGADVHATHLSGGGDHMAMYFHFGVDAVILFKEWTTSSTESIIGSVIGIFILAMIYEGIKFFREYLFKKYFTSLEYSSVSVLGDDGKPVTEVHKVARNRMLSWPHMIQTFLHVVQMILSYFLMLIFMTFNVWLCLGVILGSGVGYFLFGWRKATVVDITEHCH
ncbi:High affinity copper uptake protein 1 like protein [Argiope bruennichi]|uniref:Copper transport protein n=1 Tax=Argiope bruennichi TaxID=94029 RepID=A0A8T0EDA6_ARGBR|nr:High affinity copper uptake protein 1 like protein [Argiope bruennichi]